MSGRSAYGTAIGFGSPTPSDIANVVRIVSPDASMETIDVTAHDSASDYREIVPSFLALGECTFDLNFDPQETTHMDATGGLWDLFENKTRELWTITFTDGSTMAFNAYVTKPPVVTAATDDAYRGSVTLMADGAPTFTVAGG